MSEKSMRIAIFHLGFFYSGGGEKLVLEQMRGLRAQGHHVDCFAPYVDRDHCFPDYPEMEQVEVLLPPPPEWLPMRHPLWVALSCVLIPFIAWRFGSYDVFLGANQPAPWYAFVVSRILRKPYVVYLAQALRLLHPRRVDLEYGIRIREGDYQFLMGLKRLVGGLIDRADRVSIENADLVLTNGEYVKGWIREIYRVESYSCPAGCHPIPQNRLVYDDRWSGEVSVNGTSIPKPYILLTNRHSPMKRFEYALWALKAIIRQRSDVRLVITGQETEYTDQVKYLVDGMNLDDAVHFLGLVSEDDLTCLYSQAAVYVYPSPEEDFGMGIVEAMAVGTPVVAWNNAGPTVTVKSGETGYLVDPYDTDQFLERLLVLATNPSLSEQMGRAGHRRAQEWFSYEKHNQILQKALVDVVQASARATIVDQPPAVGPEVAAAGQFVSSEDFESNV